MWGMDAKFESRSTTFAMFFAASLPCAIAILQSASLRARTSNDYTDEGQLLGHIIIGAQMVHDLAKEIPDFPETLENQLVHCILAHHGELEYGSPKKPALAEAVALNLADNTDARMETLTEIFAADKGKKEWLGYNRLFESNLRRTGDV